VWGVAYRLKGDSEEVQKIINQLDHREQGGYERSRATFHSRDNSDRSWDVTLYLASHENPLYSPHLGDIAQVHLNLLLQLT
jgi:cation transport regulator ChaC